MTTPSAASERDRLAQPVRQSPIALVFIAWRFVRRIGVINIGAALVFALTRGFSVVLFLAAILAATAIFVSSALSWWRFTFMVDDDELLVTRGVLSVERLVIPLDRVQSVSIDQRLLHRLVGVVSASVDTAGSAGTEFEIAAIDANTAQALRLVASDARDAASSPAEPVDPAGDALAPASDEVLLHRTFRELALVGATRLPWAGLAVLAPLIAFGDQFGDAIGLGDRLERAVDRGQDLGAGSTTALSALVAGVVVVAAALGALLQVVREVVTNWDLTLHRTSTGLRRTAGLLNRTSRSSTVRRIQAITTDDTPPQRWLGVTTMTLRTFGENDISLPGSRPDDVGRLRRIAFGDASPPPLDRRLTRWFVFLAVRNTIVVAVLAGIVVSLRIGWWAAAVLVVVPVRWLVARRQLRLRRWGLGEDRMAESYELLSRHTAEVPLFKAQVVKVTQSFFERRRGLATVRVQTADGFLAVPLIDHGEASAVRDRVLYAVETDPRPVL